MKKLELVFSEAKNRLVAYHRNVNWFVFVFIVFFTIGSWTDINGMWCELPIMVHELPEGWRLPSVLTILTQASQIGPVVFLLLKWLFPKRVSFVFTIYIILGVGALSCLLLSFFWKKTAFLWGEERSIGLYTLVFTLGLLDGTSSVTFLPYIGTTFNKEYIIPNYVGESFSAMIPSIAGIIQGVGQDLGCRNVSITNKTTDVVTWKLEQIPLVPYFSVSNYYLFLFVMLCIATLSFSFLHFLPVSKRTRRAKEEPKQQSDEQDSKKLYTFDIDQNASKSTIDEQNNAKPTRNEQIILLSVILGVSFVAFGVLPGMQSYSTLPYGKNTFHLSINLSFVILPIVMFSSILSYKLSTTRIVIEFFIGLAFAAYVVAISAYSPCPILQDSWVGSALIVISWVVCHNMFMRVRCCVAAKLEVCGQRVLLVFGGCIMVGQMFGGILTYLCVNVYRLFKDVPPCVSVKEFCLANN